MSAITSAEANAKMSAKTAVPGQRFSAPPDWFSRAMEVPCRSHTITVQECPIHYLEWGERGRPGVLLVHGSAAHARWWIAVAPLLAEHYHVVATDLSGMGDSGWRKKYSLETFADEQIAVCRHAGFFSAGKPVIVGHSFGGFVVLAAAADHGDQFAGAVIMDTPTRGPRTPEGNLVRDRPMRPLPVYPDPETIMRRFRLAPEQPCENGWLIDVVARHAIRKVDGGWTWKFHPGLLKDIDVGDPLVRIENIPCPLAVVHGELSPLATPEKARAMAAAHRGPATVIEVPEARHHLMLDQPLAVVAALRALLADPLAPPLASPAPSAI